MPDEKFMWTEDRMQQLRELCGQAFSATDIAARIGAGATRNAVIGKISRMGITLYYAVENNRRKTPPPAAARPPRPAKIASIPKRPATPKTEPDRPSPDGYSPVPASPANERARNVTILDLPMWRACKFITGENADGLALYCADDAPKGSSWCPHHRAIVFNPVQPRRPPKSARDNRGAPNRNSRILEDA